MIFLIKAYVVGTHLNCIDKLMQFKWVPTTFAFKKYTGCNLKTTELLDCALIGVCAVIRSNTVPVNLSPHVKFLGRALDVFTCWNHRTKIVSVSTTLYAQCMNTFFVEKKKKHLYLGWAF